jgi:hypothetical protein
MSSIPSSGVTIETSPESVPSTPSWLGEVAIVAHYIGRLGLLEQIAQRVRFARGRFGTYDTMDFLVVLIGYALSGERTLEGFYKRLLPLAQPFMALFGRDHLPSRSALSRYLAALDQPAVEALRALFQEDLFARPLTEGTKEHQAGLQDRCGQLWKVVDIDGTRQAARQRALPCTADLPRASRRMDKVCAPGYTGRKRGEVVRTRTTILQAHTHQWLGTYANAGNGDYRGELLSALQAITSYATKQDLSLSRIILRLDGQYGDFAVVGEMASYKLCYLTRGKDYSVLDLPAVQARLQRPPDQVITHPESGTCRALFDCAKIPLPGTAWLTRVVIATHRASATPAPVGVTRDGMVYELFFTALPQEAFTAADVVHLYLHRGAFETVLCDEDQEQDPDRWVSHSPHGQQVWQILSQWMWNLRLELGHRFHPRPMRLTTFAPAQPLAADESAQPDLTEEGPTAALSPNHPTSLPTPDHAGAVIYGPPEWAQIPRSGKFASTDFMPQPDGTLRCPAGHPLYAEARRSEHDQSIRVLYAARRADCRKCLLRDSCLGHGKQAKGPRHVSAVMRPTGTGPPPALSPPSPATLHPILWGDWDRCRTRRALLDLLRTQTVTLTLTPSKASSQDPSDPVPLSRPQRAHWRLSWQERLSRNAVKPCQPSVHFHLFGIPNTFASFVGLSIA